MNENRLDKIETKIAYQEMTISELNSIVIEQQKSIEMLEKSLRAVTVKLNYIAELNGSDRGGAQKPPHY